MLGRDFRDADDPDAFGDLFTQFNQDTNPDSMGGSFSGAFRPGLQEGVDGFGPGDYSGDYTGQGDRVYWGPYNGSESSDASTAHHEQPGTGIDLPHFGPGFLGMSGMNALLGSGDGGAGDGGGGAPDPATGDLPEVPAGGEVGGEVEM